MKRIALFLLITSLSTTLFSQETIEAYSQDFTVGQGDWTIDNVNLPSAFTSIWQHTTAYGMKASAYKSSTAYESETWLISPSIDLTEAATATLSVYQTMNYGTDGMYIRISTDDNNWNDITVSPMPAGTSWTFVTGTADISNYVGKTIKIAFVYTSTSSSAPTWEIKTVTINITKSEETSCRYQNMEGLTSTALLQQLHSAITDHTVLTYNNIRADKAKVDVDANGYVIDMYAGCSFRSGDYCQGVADYEECYCHNREHSLPKSWWGGTTDEPMYTDLHHVIPTDYTANTQRSAWVYDEVSSATWSNDFGSKVGTGTTWGETAFEPVDEYKGDFARIYFYMLTCYLDKNFTQGGKGYRYFTYKDSTAGFTTAALNLLLKWHRQDSVSAQEKTRNEKVAELQGNRNPFVDDPNLVEFIWGTMKGEAYSCNAEVRPYDSTEVADAITCAEARKLALALSAGSESDEEYTVVGYVSSAQSYDNSYHSQTFWMSDERDKRQVFMAYQCKNATEAVQVGYKVAISGNLLNYSNTPEMKWGQTRILDRNTNTAVQNLEIDIFSILQQDPTARIYTITGTEITATADTDITSLYQKLPAGVYIVHTKSAALKLLIP